MLELLYTSPRKVFSAWSVAQTLSKWAFLKAWDVMLITGPVCGEAGTFKIFKDGHAVQCMDDIGVPTSPFLEVAGGEMCTSVYNTAPNPDVYELYMLDPFTGTQVNSPFFTFASDPLLYQGHFVDRGRSLFFRFITVPPFENHLAAYSLTDPPVLLWSLLLDEMYNSIHWVSDGKIMLSKTQTANTYAPYTKLKFVDYINRTAYLTTQINPYRVAVFDSHCGVVFSINVTGYTEIYYPQAVPHHLSVPVLDPATVSLYGGNTVTTHVLGDLDEPCADRPVHWYLENGLGGLKKQVTKTGIDGATSNYYFAPDNPISAGLEETIRVEVLV